MLRVIAVLVIVICTLGLAGHASAQAILDIFKKPLPEIDLLPVEEFQGKSNFIEEYPVGASDLSYEIYIPKDWKRADSVSLGSFVISDSILSTISKYLGPVSTGTRHFLDVKAIGLRYQMTAKHWMMQYLLENKYSVQAITAHNDRRVEGIYVLIEDNVSYVVRAVAQINGKNLIFAQHFIPLEEWHDNKVSQAQVLDSFKIKYINNETIEEMKTQEFLDIASFEYPATWNLKSAVVRSVDRMKVELLNISVRNNIKSLVGRIGVEMVSIFATEGIDAEIERLQNALVQKGLFVQEELSGHEFAVFENEDVLAETHVYEVLDKHGSVQSYEYWVTFMGYGDYYYVATMLTPQREVSFFQWSRNLEVYKAIVKSFKPLEEGADEGT